jgi:hypothetical protein
MANGFPLRRQVARYAIALVPLAGLTELAAQQYVAKRAPSFASWQQIAAPVAALRQGDELVVVAPRWAEPMARQVIGDEQMPMADVARPDVSRYRTALELSILGQRAPELEGWRELSRETRGKFQLRRLENPNVRPVLLDFVDALAPERVSVSAGVEATACPWTERAAVVAGGLGGHPTFPATRFQCPQGSFFNVSVTVIADQDFLPRRCIWAHPPQRGELVIRYENVDLGNVIAGHGGMYWIIERERHGAPVTLAVRANGEMVGEVVHRDGDGWAPFEMPLGAQAGARSAVVEFAVSSPNYQHRHFCFEAVTR